MRKYRTRPAGRGRPPGRSLPGWKPLWGVVAVAAVVVALAPGTVRAASAAASRASGHDAAAAQAAGRPPAGRAAALARPSEPPMTRRACPVPTAPGVAACEAIMRTDPASRQGRLAPGTLPQGYGPADLQSAYKLPSATAGAGATVAIVDAYDDPNAAADLAVYRAKYGLPPCTTANGCFRKVNQTGGTAWPPQAAGWATEISLDLDMVSAACPKCHILLVEANSDSVADLGASVNEAVALGAKYVSNSYATNVGPSLAQETQWDAQYYNHPGVVITAASGDQGWNWYPYASFPADSPHVVSVGGTSLTRDPSSPRGWTEKAWGSPTSGGTGSGCGAMPRPAWQAHFLACGTQRAYNDVSAVADPYTGVAVYDSFGGGGWGVYGGTSASTPLIAATYALAGRPAGGTYPAAALYANHSSLNDITKGQNYFPSCGPLCSAGRGWDGPTGWGTPIGVADFTAGPHGTVTGKVKDSSGKPVAGAQVMIGNATAITDHTGRYSTTALDGSYTPSASLYGYATQTAGRIAVTTGGTITQDFTLTKEPLATVTGLVHDASGHGWPLYAEVTVPGTPVAAYTDPATGKYTLTLPVTGQPYTLHTSAQFAGYQAGDTQITPAAGGLHQDIGLTADPINTNCPAGYRDHGSALSQNFNSGKTPTGWSVQNTGALSWVFDNPNHLSNDTGGSGGFALVDGDHAPSGSGTGDQTTLTSPVFNLSGAKSPVLKFSQNLQVLNGLGQVEVSTDGGLNWSTVYENVISTPNGAYLFSVPGPDTETIPLPQAAGQPKVQLRFVASYFYPHSFWQLDNVLAGQLSCQPVPGGLVTGIVRDRNTGQPVNGATVSGGGQHVTTTPEPGDPAVGGGLYQLSVPSGSQSLSVTAAGYTPGSATVTVPSDGVAQANVSLAAGRLAVSPGSVSVKTKIGGTATATLKVTNTGSAPVTFHPAAQAGPVTIAGQSPQRLGLAPVQSAPVRLVRGHFSPALGLAAAGRLRVKLRNASRSAAGPGQWAPPWVQVAHYPAYGQDMTAATDPVTGKVYATGGLTSVPNPGTYVYDPATRAWSQLADIPQPHSAAAAGMIGGKLYVTDGYDSQGSSVAELDVYDTRTRLWSKAAPIPHAGYGPAGAVLDGKLYVIGGCPQNGLCTYRYVQVYDPATNSWSQAAPYPRKISFLGCGPISGKLYCAGGFDHGLQHGTTAAYVYDPATNKWTPVAPMPIGVWGGAEATANGQLLVSGGVAGTANAVLTNQGYAFNPLTNAWSALPNAPEATYRGGSACGFYTIGGIDPQSPDGYSANVAQLPGYTGCDGGAGVGWLTVSHSQVTLAPGQSAKLTLTVTATASQVPQPGTYTATVSLYSGQPYLAPQVPVTLTAKKPAR